MQRKAKQRSYLLVRSLFSTLIFLISGCVDIDNPNISVVDFRSEVRFMNLAVGVGAATEIRIDNVNYGRVNFEEAGPYVDIPSGSRILRIAYDGVTDSLQKFFETDRKTTLFIVGDSTAREHPSAIERYIFEAPGVADTALVRVFHGSPDVGGLSIAAEDTAGTISLTTDLRYRLATGYSKLSPGSSYSFLIMEGSDTLFNSIEYQFTSNKRYTIVIYDMKASIKQKLFEDD